MSCTIESIKKKLETEADDRVIICLNYDIAFEYLTFNDVGAYKYALMAYQISKETHNQKGKKYYGIYNITRGFGKKINDSTFNDLKGLLTFFESVSDYKMIGLTLDYIGLYYFRINKYEKAYQFYFKSLEAYKELGVKSGMIKVYRHIGELLHLLKRYDDEIEYYNQALSMIDKNDRGGAYYKLLLNYGFGAMSTKLIDRVPAIIDTLEDTSNNNNYKSMKNRVLTLKGSYEISKKNWENALKYFNQSLDAGENDVKCIYLNYYYIAYVYWQLNEIERAIKYYNISYQLAIKNESKNTKRSILCDLIEIYKVLGEYKKSFELYETYYELEIKDVEAISNIRTEAIINQTKINLLSDKNNELEWMANHDDLTGIYNRRYILNQFDNVLINYKDVYIMIIDIDDFKHINDHYGHFTGDKVIVSVAKNLANIIGEKGIAGRFGGDEFIVAFHNLESGEFVDIANRIKTRINQLNVIDERITVSGGGVRVCENQTLDDALSNADELLYQVKQAGKNDVKVSL